jgi:Flp pilus assembly protein CpaB
MLSQFTRSSRGLLVIGAVLAVAAFALVVVLLNQKSNNHSATGVATGTVTATLAPGTTAVVPTPSATVGTAGLQEVAVVRDVPAGTLLSDSATIALYFKDQPALSSVPADAVPSTEAMTTNLISNTILFTSKVAKGSILTTRSYELLPFSPPYSLSYQVRPGRVAETVQVPALNADNWLILPGDFVNVLLTIRDKELDPYTSNPPVGPNSGPEQTQQLIPDVRVIDVKPTGIYTLELSQEDALILKYVKDTGGTVELNLMSSVDVKTQAQQPKTNAVVPQFFLTPVTITQGTPQRNGLINPFATALPTLTPASGTTGR